MSMMEEVNIGELERFCQEVRELFADAGEFDTIKECNQILTQIEKNINEKQKLSASLVGETAEGLETLQKEAGLYSPNEYLVKKRELEDSKLKAEERIAQLSRERVATLSLIDKYRQQIPILEKEIESYEADSNDDIPRLRRALDLYMQISSVKWHYEAEADAFSTKKVSGNVYLPDNVIPFDLDRSKMSDFELTNAVWGLLES